MVISFNNELVEVFGRQVEKGSQVDNCTLIRSNFKKVSITENRVSTIVYSVTSIVDPLYEETLKILNEYAKNSKLKIIVVTVDLPYTIKEHEKKYSNLHIYTDYMYLNFAARFGVLLEKYRLLIEAIFVVDVDNTIMNYEYFTFENRLSQEKIERFIIRD